MSSKKLLAKRNRRKRLRKKERRYNRRLARANVKKQDKTREGILRMHHETYKSEGSEGVKKNMRTMRILDRLYRFFHIKR